MGRNTWALGPVPDEHKVTMSVSFKSLLSSSLGVVTDGLLSYSRSPGHISLVLRKQRSPPQREASHIRMRKFMMSTGKGWMLYYAISVHYTEFTSSDLHSNHICLVQLSFLFCSKKSLGLRYTYFTCCIKASKDRLHGSCPRAILQLW